MDFEDVAQILRIHIAKKWDQWECTRPLEPWVNRIISNQMTNILRNVYTNFTRPCLRCSANEGGDLCSLFGKQCSDCPFFKRWEKNKKRAYDTKLAVSINDEMTEGLTHLDNHASEHNFFDFDSTVPKFHTAMEKRLSPLEFKIYKHAYIDGLSDAEIASKMEYKTTEKGRSPGYKQIKNIKTRILHHAKQVAADLVGPNFQY